MYCFKVTLYFGEDDDGLRCRRPRVDLLSFKVLEDDVWSTKHLVRKVLLDVIRLGDEKEESWIVIKVFQVGAW